MNSDHWRHIITLMTPKMKMLLAFYLEMPDYRGSCWQVGQKFGVKDASINLINTHIGMLAKKVMGNFNVQDPNNPNQNRYWSIPMNHGCHENEGFVWSMRPELVEAALEAKQKGLLPDVGHGLVDDDSIADDIPEWILNRGEDQKNLVLPWIKAYKDNWDWLCSILLEDDELVELVSGTYPDDPSEFHLTTQDFLYFVAEYSDSPIAVSAL